MHESEEDILSSSLQTLYDYVPIAHSMAGSLFTYTTPTALSCGRAGPGMAIELQTPDTETSNWGLHASSIWVASLFLADHIDELGLHDGDRDHHERTHPTRVLELGAGAGLPSILIACTYPDVEVTASDYPDPRLIRTLSDNIDRNGVTTRVRVIPYDWGAESFLLRPPHRHSHVFRSEGEQGMSEQERGSRFDVIVAADTLWNSALHSRFISSLAMCLERSSSSRVHLVAGLHTGRYTIASFLASKEMVDLGLIVESAVERQTAGGQSRPWDVSRAESEDEQERRRWVVWIVIKWCE